MAILEQGIEQVAALPTIKHLALLATQATTTAGTFQRHLREKRPHLELTTIACPLFVPLVEEGLVTDSRITQAICEHLAPLKALPLDGILLGCTHYPLLSRAISQEIGDHVPLLDPATTCAHSAQQWLKEHKLLNTSLAEPHHQFHVTANPEKFHQLARLFS